MATYIIIIILTCLISITAFTNHKHIDQLVMWPALVKQKGQYYRFITSGLIHADWMHLGFNMLTLYFFGGIVESAFNQLFGRGVFLLFYVLALIVSDLPTYFKYQNNYMYRSLGASGAISGVIFASILISPASKIGLFIIPIGIPAYIFGPLYLLYCMYMSKRGADGINHSAHFWGALFGILFTLVGSYTIAHFDLVGYFIQQVSA